MRSTYLFRFALIAALAFSSALVQAQSRSLSEVLDAGAKALTEDEVRAVVSGASTEFNLVNGAVRFWKNEPDGTFVASRSDGPRNLKSGPGTWSVNADAALCLTFNWQAIAPESYCRRLYQMGDYYYAFSLGAKPTTLSGRYKFSK